MKTNQSGKLYVVGTPIGNLDDISHRAISTLKQVDWIATEDTRHSKILLSHFNIQKKLLSLHSFNEKSRIDKLVEALQGGDSGALISDAGTPCISDPGAYLINALHLNQIPVVPIPGPCALITALSVSGFTTTDFLFTGFLSVKSSARKAKLEQLKQHTATLVCYEAPHRLLGMISDCKDVLGGERRVCIGRELTKKYETLYVSTLEEIHHQIAAGSMEVRGEFVIIIEGFLANPAILEKVNLEKARRILIKLLDEVSIKSAVQLTSELTEYPKNKLYEVALVLQQEKQKKLGVT